MSTTGKLKADVSEYTPQDPRPQADPLGERGLPRTRAGLDAKLYELIERIKAAGVGGINGRDLALDLGLRDARAVRLLVAYARVHNHVHQIIGMPGNGYMWGDLKPDIYAHAIADSQRRARCYFYTATLLKRQGVAMSAAQMVFDFMEASPHAGDSDDLAALVAAEGTSVADFLDAFITKLGQTAGGKAALAAIGKKHSQLLMSTDTFDRISKAVESLQAEVAAARRFAKAV